jgi:hypothetical protein
MSSSKALNRATHCTSRRPLNKYGVLTMVVAWLQQNLQPQNDHICPKEMYALNPCCEVLLQEGCSCLGSV